MTSGSVAKMETIAVEIAGREGAGVVGLDEERLLLVQHLIASHQGKPEWDSRHPQTREALVLHYADDLDAKMNQVGAALSGVEPGEWSDYDRSLGRSFFLPLRPDEGRRAGRVTPDDVIDLFEA